MPPARRKKKTTYTAVTANGVEQLLCQHQTIKM